MTTATAPAVSREVLIDRWQGLTDWDRTGGDASPQYVALCNVLLDLIGRVSGVSDFEPDGMIDGLMEQLGRDAADAILARGMAR